MRLELTLPCGNRALNPARLPNSAIRLLVQVKRLELLHLSIRVPKTRAAANYATPACLLRPPSAIRTHTVSGLNRLPLPLGYEGIPVDGDLTRIIRFSAGHSISTFRGPYSAF